jgi:hypothetical protein
MEHDAIPGRRGMLSASLGKASMNRPIRSDRRFIPPSPSAPAPPGTLDYATPEVRRSRSWIARQWRYCQNEFANTQIGPVIILSVGLIAAFLVIAIARGMLHMLIMR